VPAVTIWLSSGWYTALRKKVLANRLWRRLQAVRSQMMQDPSLLALTHSSSLQDAAAINTVTIVQVLGTRSKPQQGPILL
jgi:hypothetical protein